MRKRKLIGWWLYGPPESVGRPILDTDPQDKASQSPVRRSDILEITDIPKGERAAFIASMGLDPSKYYWSEE